MRDQDHETIAVIGAGLSGVVAAARLKAGSRAVHILEKSRGAGGRMATRRAGTLSFDHGAQYFRAKGPDFADEIARWTARGLAAPWGADARFVGTPAMNAPVKALVDGVPLTTGFTAARITGRPGAWTIESAEGASVGPVSAIVVAAPAPQAAALLAPVAPALAEEASRASYAPCLALMLAFPPDALGPTPIPERPADHPAIAWIADDATKPGRTADGPRRLVVHATPDFSRTHLEQPPETIADLLLAELHGLLGTRAAPIHMQAHRWRYALVETALGRQCLWDGDLAIGACGDWCLGGRVEAAFDSGAAVAAAILAEGGAA